MKEWTEEQVDSEHKKQSRINNTREQKCKAAKEEHRKLILIHSVRRIKSIFLKECKNSFLYTSLNTDLGIHISKC